MQGFQLTFFCEQDRRIGHQPVSAWMIDRCRPLGVGGVTVRVDAQALGGEGRLHSAGFFELGDQPMEITVVATPDQADHLLAELQAQQVDLFYVKAAVDFGHIGAGAQERPA